MLRGGNTFKTYTDKLKILQKKVIRLVTNSHFRQPSKPLFLEMKLLPVDELVSFSSMIFVFKLKGTW